MAFRWPADCGPTLNADFVALRVLVGAKEPYNIVISHGSAPLPL